MSSTQVLSPTDFEEQLEKYLFERSEEWRAVRVGEKEVSEQAEIVRRYADLFTREQLEALREAEPTAGSPRRSSPSARTSSRIASWRSASRSRVRRCRCGTRRRSLRSCRATTT